LFVFYKKRKEEELNPKIAKRGEVFCRNRLQILTEQTIKNIGGQILLPAPTSFLADLLTLVDNAV